MFSRFTSKINESSVLGAAFVTGGLFATSVINYFLHIFLGRTLTVSEYGEFAAFLSLSSILSIPGSAFSVGLIKVSSELSVRGEKKALSTLFWEGVLLAAVVGLFFYLVLLFGKDVISSFLNIKETSVVLPFSFYIAASFILIIPLSFLRGLSKFAEFSVSNVFNALLRLALPVTMITLSYGVAGVFFGVSVAAILSFLLGCVFLVKAIFPYHKLNLSLNPNLKRVFLFSGTSLVASLGSVMLINMDLILSKHFFDPVTAGHYSAIATIGKVFLFGTSTIEVVMFPKVSAAFSAKAGYIKKFKKYFLMQVGVVTAALLAFSIFPEVIVNVLFGEKFLPAVAYVPLYAFFVAFYVLSNFMISFYMAVDKIKLSWLPTIFMSLQFVLIMLFHDGISQILYINILSSGLLLVFLALYFSKYVRLHHSSCIQTAKDH